MDATLPGPSRLQRRAAIEDRAHLFHQALKDRATPPEITDALERELAPVVKLPVLCFAKVHLPL
jgi:hypothetical protein